ncbi:hypothetical protein GPECTOR_36g55 [Gonium pectorale]|uniref:Uncharacterized protein n=1 Tax=Gonium pectorale TaxID=33097 RepID=A0A150GDB6_GONPE|nr:hypothetical protein GPECTOR_36g55 [Gonium pectorale]|eukprot:KXZ47330.1 hypothetical protein GPECTOR_36g55 [Gonium pectorale]
MHYKCWAFVMRTRYPSPMRSVELSGGKPLYGAATGSAGVAAEEHFKRVAAAYHMLLHVADGNAGALPGPAAAASWAHGAASGAGAAAEAAVDDEQLADLVSADLLLEASRLRLSEFDLIFLHQRASGGASGLPSVWPDAAQSVDDIWRRIRRRVEKRRKRQGAR